MPGGLTRETLKGPAHQEKQKGKQKHKNTHRNGVIILTHEMSKKKKKINSKSEKRKDT